MYLLKIIVSLALVFLAGRSDAETLSCRGHLSRNLVMNVSTNSERLPIVIGGYQATKIARDLGMVPRDYHRITVLTVEHGELDRCYLPEYKTMPKLIPTATYCVLGGYNKEDATVKLWKRRSNQTVDERGALIAEKKVRGFFVEAIERTEAGLSWADGKPYSVTHIDMRIAVTTKEEGEEAYLASEIKEKLSSLACEIRK